MTKTEVSSKNLPRSTGPLSQGVVAGPLVFTSGFGPSDPVSGDIVGETIEEQTAQTLSNVRSVLREAGLDLEDVVKVTAHLLDIDRDFVGFNDAYQEAVPPPYPVRTTVGSRLGGGILVEIDVVALRRT